MREIFVSPSILAANFTDMRKAVSEIEKAGADWIHCDVMDGVFVPNITFGQKMVSDIKKITQLPLDVHLMIMKPEKYVEEFIDCGSSSITIHYESSAVVPQILEKIRERGVKAGISIKPGTDVSALRQYLDAVDMITVMSVQPGFAGQSYMPEVTEKIAKVKEMIGERQIILQVDGGINTKNIAEVIDAGADCVVAGSVFFNSKNKTETVNTLKRLDV